MILENHDELRRAITSLLTGAGVAMIALTSTSIAVIVGSIPGLQLSDWFGLVSIAGSSACATIFVLSLLHSDLNRYYDSISQREHDAIDEARRDSLTGLNNRRSLIERLTETSEVERHRQERCSYLVILDLDQFKQVNDTLGHDAGDTLLVEVSQRLEANLNCRDIFRLGGDEFALIIEHPDRGSAESFCRDLRAQIVGTYWIGDKRASIGCSVGAARLGGEVDPSTAMRRADLAMYRAKENSLMVVFFDESMHFEVEREANLSANLRLAVDDRQGISTKFQPIFSRDRQIVALEGLFRWHDSKYGNIEAAEAIQIARRNHILDEISFFVADQSCATLQQYSELRLCLNLEATQLLDTAFAEAIDRLINGYDISRDRIQLEISEADFVQFGARMEPILLALAESGFRIAVDDFGSSNSSLSHLAGLGVTAIKFDHSVIRNAREARNIAIVQAKVGLAKSLGMEVTCKHISDHEEEAVALQSGADFVQGFYYGRPDKIDVFVCHTEHPTLLATG